MKFNFIVGIVFLLSMPVMVSAQHKVTDKSGKEPDWTTRLEKGYIIGIGNGQSIETAKKNAFINVKAQIVSSVADFISASSTSKTEEITADKYAQFYQQYSEIITTQSGKRDYLQGVSESKADDFYWEERKDKKTKDLSYKYFIKYPFSQFDLDRLVRDFREKDEQLTQELNGILWVLDNFTSVEEINQSKSQLQKLSEIFIDERKAKALVGIEKCNGLISSIYLSNAGSELGTLKYSLKIGDKPLKTAKTPVINANCAEIQDRKFGDYICRIDYLFDGCYDEPGNHIRIRYSFGNHKPEKSFYFDVTENKAELVISGNIKMIEGAVSGDNVRNATCIIPLKSKYDSPVTVSKIILEWKEAGIIKEVMLNKSIAGKGQHEIRFEIPGDLNIASVSTVSDPGITLNGSLLYTSDKTGENKTIRIYRYDYTTAW
jgi:hypothetical protein